MPKAKYEGIYHSIKKRIEAQDYPYQSLLPSENTLIEEYACSRNTVRRALAELVADGYVQSMQGRGVRVIYQPVGKTTFTIGGIENKTPTYHVFHMYRHHQGATLLNSTLTGVGETGIGEWKVPEVTEEVILHRHFKYIGLKTYKSCIKTAFVYTKFLRY